MKIGNISNVSFKAVHAISGSKDQIVNLYNGLLEEMKQEKALIMPATDIYKNSSTNGECSKAAKEGKEVAFLITGKNVKDALFMNPGWGSLNGISHHIISFFEIKDDKTAIANFKAVIQKDCKEDDKDKKDE